MLTTRSQLDGIPSGWLCGDNCDWEKNADKCCDWLEDEGYVEEDECRGNTHGPGIRMDIVYTSIDKCTADCSYINERRCNWQDDIPCGAGMSIAVLNPCGSYNHDSVNGLWDNGCKGERS